MRRAPEPAVNSYAPPPLLKPSTTRAPPAPLPERKSIRGDAPPRSFAARKEEPYRLGRGARRPPAAAEDVGEVPEGEALPGPRRHRLTGAPRAGVLRRRAAARGPARHRGGGRSRRGNSGAARFALPLEDGVTVAVAVPLAPGSHLPWPNTLFFLSPAGQPLPDRTAVCLCNELFIFYLISCNAV